MLYIKLMIDPRIKGFMTRLAPSMVVAGGVSFCLFTLMSLMIATKHSTTLIPMAEVIRVENSYPVQDTVFSENKETEVLPKAYFIKHQVLPSEPEYKIQHQLYSQAIVPIERIKPVISVEMIKIAMNPIIDRDAILLAASSPMYPHSAEKNNIEGHIVVAMNVDSDGKVDDVWVIEASPVGYFEDYALRAAKKFKYQPRIKNGKKVVAANLQYRWDFNLPSGS